MKKLIIAAILFTLASCAAQEPADPTWGKWGDPNYISNEYSRPEAIRTTGTTPMTIAPGWAVSR